MNLLTRLLRALFEYIFEDVLERLSSVEQRLDAFEMDEITGDALPADDNKPMTSKSSPASTRTDSSA